MKELVAGIGLNWIWLVVILGAAGLAAWFLMNRHPRSLTQKMGDKIKHAQFTYITDIELPDGIGGILDIEQLVLTQRGLVVIDRLEAEGRVFGATNIDLWTQILNGRSVKFENPLYQLSVIKQVVKNIIPGVPVHGLIVLGESASFEKGTPEGVVTLADLPMMLASLPHERISEALCEQAWQRLLRIARKDGKAISTT